jgi:hypothetical protein
MVRASFLTIMLINQSLRDNSTTPQRRSSFYRKPKHRRARRLGRGLGVRPLAPEMGNISHPPPRMPQLGEPNVER